MDDATTACARLLHQGAVKRSDLPQLEHPDVRRSVEERLASVGLELAASAYSDHFGLRLSPEACATPGFDAASNVGLASDACALLVVLWSKLVLQKRAATDARDVPGETSLFPEQRERDAAAFTPQVRVETLRREFAHVFPNKTRLTALLSQLRRLGFVRLTGDAIEPGPFLELGFDGERMVTYIRREVIASLIAGRADAPAQPEAGKTGGDDVEREVLALLGVMARPASRSELTRASGHLSPQRVSRALKGLVKRRLVTCEGLRGNARYSIVPARVDVAATSPGTDGGARGGNE